MPTRRALAGLTAGALAALYGRDSINLHGREALPGFLAAGACDSHVHAVGDPARFPMAPDRSYTPQPATAEDLEGRLNGLGIERVVIVTPTIYGFDPSATLSAIAQLGRHRARGSIFLPADAPRRHLEQLARGGVVGIRLFLADGERIDRDLATKRLSAATEVARNLGWSLQIAAPPEAVVAVQRELLMSPVPVILDTFAWLAGGIGQPGFETIRSLLTSGVGYVKLSEPYRLSKRAPDYDDVKPLARALVEANPDRVVWGSGWPHVPSDADPAKRTQILPPLPVDTRRMLTLLETWAPDPSHRRKILVDNPSRLFGFDR